MSRRLPLRSYGRPLGAAVALLAGGILHRVAPPWGHHLWLATLLVLGVPLVARTLAGVLRGRFAADVVAALAILGALLLDEPLAGLVIVLMQSGGEALERYAEGRASEAVRQLEADAPRTAHRWLGAALEEVPVEAVRVGDRLLVRPGELVPCDARVVEGDTRVDTARITGEPLPRHARPGTPLPSGAQNLESPVTVEATAPAAESQYARIVALVRSAESSKAPLQREADRWAAWFTPVTLLACAAAWFLSGDVHRVLAVLVVATPCPLILAAPVAVIGGIDRAARHGMIFRHGTALEQLGRTTAVILDKTGTLTFGRPEVTALVVRTGWDERELLAQVASVEHGAGHQLARSIVAAAAERGIVPAPAQGIVETAGRGVRGTVDGRALAVGSLGYLDTVWPEAAAEFRHRDPPDGLTSFIAVDGRAAGVIRFADRPRPEAPATVAALRTLGIGRVLVRSGDHATEAMSVAHALGITDVRGDVLPEDKLTEVRALQGEGERVLMVGDGVNDAPALAAAEVGVALAAHGGGVSAEAAGLVLLQDDLSRLPDAIVLSRRTLRVARQSIGVGLALSAVGMLLAAVGLLRPVAGAVAQEVIDVAVILWALRAAAPLPPPLAGGRAGR